MHKTKYKMEATIKYMEPEITVKLSPLEVRLLYVEILNRVRHYNIAGCGDILRNDFKVMMSLKDEFSKILEQIKQ